MARYGDGTLYGSGAKYGDMIPVDRLLTWALEIDWDNDGIFNGENEGMNLFGMTTERGRLYMLNSDDTGFQPVDTGKMFANLMNLDRRYDPYYTSGALYGLILPGRKFRLRVKDEATAVVYDVIAGNIADMQPENNNGVETVTFEGHDGADLLNEKVYISLYENITIDDAIRYLLTAVGWTGATDIDSLTDYLPYWWTKSDESVIDQINDLADSSLGHFFISASGEAVYKSRNDSGLAEITLDGSDILYSYGVKLPQPWEVVKNSISVVSSTRVKAATGTIWQLQDTPQVVAGGSITLWAEYAYNNDPCPAKDVINPVATTDYTMNSAADGSGTNLTANFTVTIEKYSTWAKLTVTNNGGTSGYITLLKVRGDAIYIPYTSTVKSENAESIAAFQTRSFTLHTDWLQDINFAISVAEYLAQILGTPCEMPELVIRDTPAKQFAMDLFDRVDANLPAKSLWSTYLVGHIKHEWTNRSGNNVKTTLKLEEAKTLIIGTTWTFTTYFGVAPDPSYSVTVFPL